MRSFIFVFLTALFVPIAVAENIALFALEKPFSASTVGGRHP